MITKDLSRRTFLELGTAAIAGLAITPQAIAQAPKGGPLMPFNIVSPGGTLAIVFTELMKQKGYFEKYGLDVKSIAVSDGGKIVSALVSGEVDLVRSAGFGQVLTAIDKSGPLKIVCGAGLPIGQELYTAKPEIKTLKDLEGRIIGSGQPGTLLHQMTMALLQKNKVDVSKVQFVNVGASPDVLRAVVAGTVDAGPASTDAPSTLKKMGLVSLSKFWIDLPEYPYNAGFTADRTIAEKREGIIRALAAFGEMYKFVQGPDSHDAFVKAYRDATNGKDSDSAEYNWKYLQEIKPYGLIIPDASIDYLQNLNVGMGIQKAKMPNDKILDLSMAREALKRVG